MNLSSWESSDPVRKLNLEQQQVVVVISAWFSRLCLFCVSLPYNHLLWTCSAIFSQVEKEHLLLVFNRENIYILGVQSIKNVLIFSLPFFQTIRRSSPTTSEFLLFSNTVCGEEEKSFRKMWARARQNEKWKYLWPVLLLDVSEVERRVGIDWLQGRN